MEALNFLHLSDTHVNARPEKGFVKYDVAAKLRRVFDLAAAGPGPMDFCLITGDLAHEGDDEDYRFLAALVAEAEELLGCPVIVCLGNHDNREAFFRSYLGTEPEQRHTQVQTIKGLRIITLDSKVGAHTVTGRIGPEQLAWLESVLETPAQRGSIVILHHPPMSPVQPDMESHCLEDREALAAVLEGSDVIGLFSGHTHATAFAPFLPGVMNCTAASTAFNLRVSQDAVQMLDTTSWNLCKLDGQNRLVFTAMNRSEDRVAAEIPLAALASHMTEYDPETYPVVECTNDAQ